MLNRKGDFIMNKKNFITENEHKRCQAIKEVFAFHHETSSHVYLSDCQQYGYCFFEEFINGNFESAQCYQNAEELFKIVLDSFKTDYIYAQFKASHPASNFLENIEDALSLQEKEDLEILCQKLKDDVEKKWHDIEHTFLWEILTAAQDIISKNPTDDILYSPKHGYYYSSVHWHNGYYANSSDAPIRSAEDMLKYIEIIWAWNDYQQHNLNYYVPNIREILEDLQCSLPADEWEKETSRRTAAMSPFREMITKHYSVPYHTSP